MALDLWLLLLLIVLTVASAAYVIALRKLP